MTQRPYPQPNYQVTWHDAGFLGSHWCHSLADAARMATALRQSGTPGTITIGSVEWLPAMDLHADHYVVRVEGVKR